MPSTEVLNNTTQSLERMQHFDPSTLARIDDLGKEMHFEPVVPSARRLIDLYKRLTVSSLEDFTDAQLNQIKGIADADFNRFSQILAFSVTQPNPSEARSTLIQQVVAAYDTTFNNLWQFIAYGVSKTIDSQRLENEARAALQNINDQVGEVSRKLKGSQDEAATILAEIRKTAAEQGVSQQAVYFKSEADEHELAAKDWGKRTFWWATGTGGFALASLFLHNWDLLKAHDQFEAYQLISSKLVVFAVLAYMLVLSGRNFLAHKHNAVVNKHRQNALLTYTALVDAAGDRGSQDVVLTHAASCIFAPQDSGYTKKGTDSGSKSVIEYLPKAISKE